MTLEVNLKVKNKVFLGLLMTVLTCFLWSNAQALPIDDNPNGAHTYYGADDHGRGDVIGNQNIFNIRWADIDLLGTQLQVTINTPFAGKGDDGLFRSITHNQGIGYGDLFLANYWNPVGTPHYLSDNALNGTHWTYGFALDDRWNAAGGSGALYAMGPAVAGNNNPDAFLTEDFLSGGIYRTGQAVAVKTAGKTAINSGHSWSVDELNELITFTLNIQNTSLLDGDKIAIHWGPTCNNDVVEGELPIPTPEPASLLLCGSGLIGLSMTVRKKLKANKE